MYRAHESYPVGISNRRSLACGSTQPLWAEEETKGKKKWKDEVPPADTQIFALHSHFKLREKLIIIQLGRARIVCQERRSNRFENVDTCILHRELQVGLENETLL